MATTYHKLSGEFAWVKVYTPDPEYGHYSIDLYMDEPSWKKFHDLGLQLSVRTDKEGKEFVRFRRDHEKFFKGQDEVTVFGPPEVTGTDGEHRIANGSKGTIDIAVYTTKKGKGHRLNRVMVTEFIPYIPQPKPEGSEVATKQESTSTERKKNW